MPGPWIDAVILKQALADRLKKSVASLQGYWDNIVTDALSAGYSDLVVRLLAKGFTVNQLDAWDDRVRFNKDQSLFWCFVNGAGLGDYSDLSVNKLDHRAELEKSATIMISGIATPPGATAETGVTPAVGSLTQQSDGIDYGSTFGLKINRKDGRNEYGDSIDRW